MLLSISFFCWHDLTPGLGLGLGLGHGLGLGLGLATQGLGLGLATRGLGLGLATSGLVNITAYNQVCSLHTSSLPALNK